MKSIGSFRLLTVALEIAFVPVAPASVTVTGQAAGPTPFISEIDATISAGQILKSVQFTIVPKQGSVTRPVSATYTAAYLKSRGYLNTQTGALVVPIFGLYANYANTVSLRYVFSNNTSQQDSVVVNAPDWADPCGQFDHPTVMQARTASTNLSFDYFLIKNDCGTESPVLMDSDGLVRWVGTAGVTSHGSMLFANGIYISSPTPTSSVRSGLARMEFDGTLTFLHDYSDIGVTGTGHHNYDPGREGMLLEVDTTSQTESVIIEVDGLGNPLRTWNLASIISAAMTAGGDDPNQFVHPAPNDWFHNNAATYRKSDDSLVVSSRENFVIALEYETGAIKWILGDPTKQWYQFPSLRNLALTLTGKTLPPIGQHAVSFTVDDDLLLFDDGFNSGAHTPAGTQRDYSTPRRYQLDGPAGAATELWNYSNGQPLYSRICSSIYEDAANNYLIDYADINNLGNTQFAELVGLGSAGDKVFDYRYTTTFCSTAWNAIPIHLESMMFATVDPVSAVSRKVQGAAGAFDVNLPLSGASGVEGRSGGTAGAYQMVISFARPVTVSSANVTDGPNGHAAVVGSPVVNGNQVTVNLTQVSASDSLLVTLFGVNDGTNLGTVAVPMRVVLGDCNGDGKVNKTDVKLTEVRKSKRGLSLGNFRADVTADGFINQADTALVNANLGRTVAP